MSLNFETLRSPGISLMTQLSPGISLMTLLSPWISLIERLRTVLYTAYRNIKGDNSEDSKPEEEYNELIEKSLEILKTTLDEIFEPITELPECLRQLFRYAEDLLAENRRILYRCETLKSEIRSLVNKCCSMLEDVQLYLENVNSLASICLSGEISEVNRELRLGNVQSFLWFVEDVSKAIKCVQHYNKKVMVSVEETRNAAELGKETCERERSKAIRQKEKMQRTGKIAAGTSALAIVAGGLGALPGVASAMIGGFSGTVAVVAVIEAKELNKAIQCFSAMIGPSDEILSITKETSISIDRVQEKNRELERDVKKAKLWGSRNRFNKVQKILIAVGTKADELAEAATISVAEVKKKKLQLRRM